MMLYAAISMSVCQTFLDVLSRVISIIVASCTSCDERSLFGS